MVTTDKFKGHEAIVLFESAHGYAFNLVQAYLFRQCGFLAPLTMRVSMYLIWHVAWGAISQV